MVNGTPKDLRVIWNVTIKSCQNESWTVIFIHSIHVGAFFDKHLGNILISYEWINEKLNVEHTQVQSLVNHK